MPVLFSQTSLFRKLYQYTTIGMVSLVVQGDEKEIRSFQLVQHGLSSCFFGHRLTEGAAQSIQDAGLQEERLDLMNCIDMMPRPSNAALMLIPYFS